MKYDKLVKKRHADILSANDETLEEARKKEHIVEYEDKIIWKLMRKGYIVVEIPQWLAEKKILCYGGSFPPTIFFGKIEKETEKAIFFEGKAMETDERKLKTILEKIIENEVTKPLEELFGMNHISAWLPRSQVKIWVI